jgi:hypothetical protein
MGVDIHMSIIDKGEIIAKEIFDGRNSEWFQNLQGEGWDDEYSYLPIGYGFPEDAPKDFVEKYDDRRSYYGHCYVKVADFMKWFADYRPDLHAGWVNTYDKWRMENKHWIPDDLPHSLDKDDNPNDWHFVEYQNIYDCSRWLYQYLCDNKIHDDAWIVYCFDH